MKITSARTNLGAGGLLAAAALLLFTPGASGKTIVVPTDVPKIQQAVNQADAGDRILVEARNRRYFENVTITTNRLRIVGVPRDGEMPIVDGTSRVGDNDDEVFDITASDVSLRKLDVRNGYGIDCTGARCAFERLEMHMSDQSGDCVEIDGAQGRVERSEFLGCDDNNVDIEGNRGKVLGNFMRSGDNGCLEIDGDKAVVHRNSIRNCEDGEAVDFNGNGSVFTNNVARSADNQIFRIDGDANLVRDNHASTTDDQCYEVTGNRARVIDNRGVRCEGYEVRGENMRVVGNRMPNVVDDEGFDIDCQDNTDGVAADGACRRAVVARNFASGNNDDDEGFEISTFGTPGGMVIRDNVSEANNDGGFDIDADRSKITSNVSRRDGSEGNEPGIEIDGLRNVVVGNVAVASGEHGLEVGDNNNAVRHNVSRRNNGDGIYVDFGTGNTLRENRAIGNNGDGIDNNADATKLVRNSSSDNRVDCTNDGTIAVKRKNRCADGSNFNGPGTLDRVRAKR